MSQQLNIMCQQISFIHNHLTLRKWCYPPNKKMVVALQYKCFIYVTWSVSKQERKSTRNSCKKGHVSNYVSIFTNYKMYWTYGHWFRLSTLFMFYCCHISSLKNKFTKKRGGGSISSSDWNACCEKVQYSIYIALTKVRLIKICYQKLYFYFL